MLGTADERQTAMISDLIPGDDWTIGSVREAMREGDLRAEFRGQFRLFFEVHGTALVRPDRCGASAPRVLRSGLDSAVGFVQRTELPDAEAETLCTLLLAPFWGLLLDVPITRDVARTTAAVQQVASLADGRIRDQGRHR